MTINRRNFITAMAASLLTPRGLPAVGEVTRSIKLDVFVSSRRMDLWLGSSQCYSKPSTTFTETASGGWQTIFSYECFSTREVIDSIYVDGSAEGLPDSGNLLLHPMHLTRGETLMMEIHKYGDTWRDGICLVRRPHGRE